MLMCYLRKEFKPDTLELIGHAKEIMGEYTAAGDDLTLRQLYYQFVARNIFANTERNYHRLSRVISDARLAGMLDWNILVDRLRQRQGNSHWNSIADILRSCASCFRYDTRDTQDNYVEIWIEKDALAGVMLPVCYEYDVNAMVCRGYVSKSAMWQASQRFLYQWNRSKTCHIIHLGDHDPSGLDMTRDIREQLNDVFQVIVQVHRIALTMEQIQQYNLPPNPTKLSDSRSSAYIKLYGHESWELDALKPAIIRTAIENRIVELTDMAEWGQRLQDQRHARDTLTRLAEEHGE